MRISEDDRLLADLDIVSNDLPPDSAQPEPTTAEIAAAKEANTKSTEQTQVSNPASGKGSILNDMV